MRKQRILHCVPTMKGGGAERQCAYLVTELVRMGWQVDVALWAGGDNMARLEASGARIHWLKGFHQFDPRLAWQMVRIIGRTAPDLVQTWTGVMDIPGGMACRLRSVPWLACERGRGALVPECMGYSRGRIRLAVTRGASAVVCNSAAALATWEPYLPQRTPCYPIGNILPLKEIQRVLPRPLVSRTGSESTSKTLLAVGRFVRGKNGEALINAIALLSHRVDLHAVFCGVGPWQRRIEHMVRQRNLSDRVTLAGYVPDVWARMKSADVCVSISLCEGCPNVVMEAMACGCPLVVSDIPPHRELVDSETALIVDHRAPRQVADAIVQVLSQPDKSRRRARRAQARAEQWTPELIAGQYEDVYRDILTRRRT